MARNSKAKAARKAGGVSRFVVGTLPSPPRNRMRAIVVAPSSQPGGRISQQTLSLSPSKSRLHNPENIVLDEDPIIPDHQEHVMDGQTFSDMYNVQMTRPMTPPLSTSCTTQSYIHIASKRKRSQISDFPLKYWKPYRQSFLDEILRGEGRGVFAKVEGCIGCRHKEKAAIFRCKDCFGEEMLCRECVLGRHGHLPLHCIQQWVEPGLFKPISLKAMGLRIQLGDHPDSQCPMPTPSHQDFCVVDMNGQHEVDIQFCGCGYMKPHWVQLLRIRWYPATVADPKTVVTFNVLRQFHNLSLQGKISAYDFYTSITRITDNTGLRAPKSRYVSFLRAFREWRNLILLKRAGRGHDPTGVEGTKAGELAVVCPACPIPGVNIPNNFQEYPSEVQFLYSLFLAIDANFRLKRRNVSSLSIDPPLSNGQGYFVEWNPYQAYFTRYGAQADQSTCTRLDAVQRANTRDIAGLDVSGVGACVCSRHMFLRPNGIGDLQKGERYANMDFIFFSSIVNIALLLPSIIISYDIACQWSKNISKRASQLPAHMTAPVIITLLTYLIPKFHLPGHGSSCQSTYSHNLAVGVGRTDGEGIERDWSWLNSVAAQTKEMGPGNREEAIEDHIGDMNFRRLKSMKTNFKKRLLNVTSEQLKQREHFEAFCQSLPQKLLNTWITMVVEWEKDHTNPNPYECAVNYLTQAEVRRIMAAEEETAAQEGETALHEVSPAVALVTGLEIEDAQARLHAEVATKAYTTSAQLAKLQEKRTALRRRIDNWRAVQTVYMPGIMQYCTRTLVEDRNSTEDIQPEDIKLWLPSELPVHVQSTICLKELPDKEWRLRQAQALDALSELRASLCVRAHMIKFKRRNEVGQRPNTRANTFINTNVFRTKGYADRYRRAYTALMALDANRDKWQETLLPLRDSDIVPLRGGLYDPDVQKKKDKLRELGEGYHMLSWIWRAPGTIKDHPRTQLDQGMHDALRIEWARSRARAERWTEELILLKEEMRRVIVYFEWRARWWKDICCIHDVDVILQEGLNAYALEHTCMFAEMAASFRQSWMPILVSAHEYVGPVEGLPDSELEGDNGLDTAEMGNGLDLVGDAGEAATGATEYIHNEKWDAEVASDTNVDGSDEDEGYYSE